MALEADFHPVMLFINNLDKPGFIGALGTMLGEANINIATFHLGRQAAGAGCHRHRGRGSGACPKSFSTSFVRCLTCVT